MSKQKCISFTIPAGASIVRYCQAKLYIRGFELLDCIADDLLAYMGYNSFIPIKISFLTDTGYLGYGIYHWKSDFIRGDDAKVCGLNKLQVSKLLDFLKLVYFWDGYGVHICTSRFENTDYFKSLPLSLRNSFSDNPYNIYSNSDLCKFLIMLNDAKVINRVDLLSLLVEYHIKESKNE